MDAGNWIALLAALGGGGIAAALIAAFIGRELKIAELRQAWINGLREDVAQFLGRVGEWMDIQKAMIERERRALSSLEATSSMPTPEDDAALRLIEFNTESTLFRIMLRLNPDEEDHKALLARLRALRHQNIKHKSGFLNEIDDAAVLAQRVLKREWQVTKWSFAADKVARMKVAHRERADARYLAGVASGLRNEEDRPR